MPKDKPDEKPSELTNPATAAHLPHAPEPEPLPKAEKPAMKMPAVMPDEMPKAEKSPARRQAREALAADEPKAELAPQATPAAPASPQRTINELLADPSFDPDGPVRRELAVIANNGGGLQFPPADLVDEHGMVVG